MKLETIREHDERCEANKQKMKRGPWTDEPNRLNWKAHGLDCMIVRNTAGLHLCGYVGVTKEHPDFKKEYDDVCVDVHGGLTYGELCGGAICHFTEDGDDETYWLGFDCAHLGDYSPTSRYLPDPFEKYREIEFVKGETERLAEQLAQRSSQ